MNKMVLTVGATLTAFAALAAEKLPTDYGDPANDIESGSVEGLTWTGAARAYKIENDVVLVFTDTTAGNCSFTIANKKVAEASCLLVGGGGSGAAGSGAGTWSAISGGGGAGGEVNFVEGLDFTGANAVTVGAGGANGAAGSTSVIGTGDELTAKGGGAGSGQTGGSTTVFKGGTSDHAGTGAGGAGASEDGATFIKDLAKDWIGGKGGDGVAYEITGDKVWYAGGGAGGSSGYQDAKDSFGGKGGGGNASENWGVAQSSDGGNAQGGGGAGACGSSNGGTYVVSNPGKGGDGVVVVRITSIRDEKPLEGLSFNGESEWYNLKCPDGNETVVVFKNTDAPGSFTLSRDAVVRVLVVGGGGAGGKGGSESQVGGGGGAGGMLTNAVEGTDFACGTYQVSVGAGGKPSASVGAKGGNGGASQITCGAEILFSALGGGAGGNPAQTAELAKGSNGGSGGGGAVYSDGDYVGQSGGEGNEGQGNGGAAANTPVADGAYGNAGGGGGAGEVGHTPPDSDREWRGGAGGDGLPSDITGTEIWYAGGGAGGVKGWFEDKTVSGGNGGGGKSATTAGGYGTAEDGADGLGGGGAGMSAGPYGWTIAGPGRGGNGVVIVRVKKVYPPEEPLDGVSFTGAAEWYNVGHGKTRETVVVYKNVEEAGTLTLSRGVTARVLLVGGGGPGGNGQQTGAGGGGGAGGFVEANDAKLRSGSYTITVGKGGEPKYTGGKDFNNNGNPSILSRGTKVVFKALGGGGGANTASSEGAGWLYACGNPFGYCTTDGVNYDYTKCDVASGGGGTYMGGWYSGPQYGGLVVGDQGNNGGDCGKKVDGTFADWQTPGGGGGAGTAAKRQENQWVGGAGGDGKMSNITGDEVYYAGGGAGGAGCYNELKSVAGGLGGGGSALMDNRTADLIGEPGNGTDGLGGGGAGSCYGYAGPGGSVTIAPGRGGNGVVIVRITKLNPQGLTVIIH